MWCQTLADVGLELVFDNVVDEGDVIPNVRVPVFC